MVGHCTSGVRVMEGDCSRHRNLLYDRKNAISIQIGEVVSSVCIIINFSVIEASPCFVRQVTLQWFILLSNIPNTWDNQMLCFLPMHPWNMYSWIVHIIYVVLKLINQLYAK